MRAPGLQRLHQLAREHRRERIGEAERRAVGDLPELRVDRFVQPRMTVPVQIRPDRRVAIEILAAARVVEQRALAARR